MAMAYEAPEDVEGLKRTAGLLTDRRSEVVVFREFGRPVIISPGPFVYCIYHISHIS